MVYFFTLLKLNIFPPILYGFRVVLAISDINEVFQGTLLFTHFWLVGFNLEIIPRINNSINGVHQNYKNPKLPAAQSSKEKERKKVRVAHPDFPKMADTTLLSCLSRRPSKRSIPQEFTIDILILIDIRICISNISKKNSQKGRMEGSYFLPKMR